MATFFASTAGKWLICITIIAVAVAVSLRQIRKMTEPPRPPREELLVVIRVVNGVTIVVKDGPLGRREATVTLSDICAPSNSETTAEPSRANLERLAGTRIRIEYAGRRRLFGEAHDSEEQPEATESEPEAHGPLLGVCYGESGACLNLEQVTAGWVSCLPSASKEWKAAEAAAKKAKLGIWAKGK